MISFSDAILIGAGVCGFILVAGIIYYRRRIARALRDEPELARLLAIKQRTRTSYRAKKRTGR